MLPATQVGSTFIPQNIFASVTEEEQITLITQAWEPSKLTHYLTLLIGPTWLDSDAEHINEIKEKYPAHLELIPYLEVCKPFQIFSYSSIKQDALCYPQVFD